MSTCLCSSSMSSFSVASKSSAARQKVLQQVNLACDVDEIAEGAQISPERLLLLSPPPIRCISPNGDELSRVCKRLMGFHRVLSSQVFKGLGQP
ncbi:uncharacterized protein STAUR_8332 [Stigmatella aurantiaca DW4/3-1]|uniref:Uncharacterized protein n=1 Tax=Stigmatella aurantiaca (strain DW4/3-1) TaxID=378806 RepID=E3FXV7_STIAD|nr:uncharacterized protein STAUR_8332 [Stigmatella aurantiaca DW4/3-1]